MPISLRLPLELETQITGHSARLGLTKSALIVRSVTEFLAKHAQPSSAQIYEEAMRAAQGGADDTGREAAEQRPHKRKTREAVRARLAKRSRAAAQALQTSPRRARKAA